MKTCSKCGESKDSLQFYKDSRRKDGLRPWCKSCCNLDSKSREARYSETREKYREKSKTKSAQNKRKYYAKNKDKILESNAIWRKSDKGRLLAYRKSARERGILFNLSEEQFLSFWQKPCYYCGDYINTIGLDRLDSNLGYEIDNVISCCQNCNKMKMALDIKEFTDQIKRIHDNLFGGQFYEVH